MQLSNADSFSDLCPDDQLTLLTYIQNSFKMTESINLKQSAYGLKARFNRMTGENKKHHVTSQCFMEAMIKSGFKAAPIKDADEPNWNFNIGKTHFTD